MTASAPEAAQRRDVGLAGVVMFGTGTAIGVSIFTVLQPAASVAGSGLLPALLLAAAPMLLFAVTYAYLGSAVPVSGASYEWPRRFLHPFVGFLISWLRILSNVGALTVLALILVSYVGMVVALPLKPTMAVLLTVIFALNYIGVSVAAKVQNLLMVLLLAVFGVFVAGGLPQVDATVLTQALDAQPLAVLAAVPLMISLFLGIEAAVEIGEEVRQPRRNIPLGIALAIGLTALVYGLVSITALGALGVEGLSASAAPLLEAAQVVLGSWAMPVIVAAAAVAILTSMNSIALTFSRSLLAMGRAGAFPKALGKIHPRFATPHRAVLAGYALAMMGLLLPSSLIFLLLAVNIPTMMKYVACSLSAVRVAKAHPEVHARSSLGLSRRTAVLTGYLAAGCGLAIIAAGFQADWRPYALVAGWAVAGVVFWGLRRRFMAA
ncbi:MAG TPA: APC family permease [Pedomonas sp.]|nr:APC family permease [Pedomonas sp.]